MAATLTEKAIKQAIADRITALHDKDIAGVMASGAPGFVSYSLAPPLRNSAGKAGLEAWFATWDGPIGYELRDLKIVAGDQVAFTHALVHMTGRKIDGEAVDLWFRQTLGLKMFRGAWKIIHGHDSTPFYMDGSFKAAVDLRP
ncbi:MAG TPA: nuclear transport factor 2 family protein [Caulobacteraceae bacterium]|jgi:PhnB protein|nr:nuclear transport factor 2 family protein [Caulobacteraceae bacterium]